MCDKCWDVLTNEKEREIVLKVGRYENNLPKKKK